MILIRNTQRTIPVDIKKLKRDTETILSALKYQDFDIGIWLCSNKTIHEYNKQYRNKDKPTDILSFPYHPELKAGERIKPETEEDRNLGDIIIAPAYVAKDAEKLGVSFEKRMEVLLVHGICHLLGYDHIEDEDYKVMHRKELALLKKLS
jgi:rRNA maturation RNase YbeY